MTLETLDTAQCRNCRYSLRGLTIHRCPECGTEFNPSLLETMYVPSSPGPLARMLLHPFGKTTNILAFIGTVLIVFSTPGLGILLPLGQLLWIAVFARWIVRLLFRLIIASRYHLPLANLPGGWRRFMFMPLWFILLFMFVWCGAVAFPAFLVSYPALIYTADHGSPGVFKRHAMIGIFDCADVVTIDAGIRFRLADNCNTSLLYASPNYTPVQDMYDFHHLGGNWYLLIDPDYPGGILTLRGLFTLGGERNLNRPF